MQIAPVEAWLIWSYLELQGCADWSYLDLSAVPFALTLAVSSGIYRYPAVSTEIECGGAEAEVAKKTKGSPGALQVGGYDLDSGRKNVLVRIAPDSSG